MIGCLSTSKPSAAFQRCAFNTEWTRWEADFYFTPGPIVMAQR
jgi:hypothetical protein